MPYDCLNDRGNRIFLHKKLVLKNYFCETVDFQVGITLLIHPILKVKSLKKLYIHEL